MGFGILQRNLEIVALKAAGLSPLVYTQPILIAAFAISVFNFVFTDIIVRPLNHQTATVWKSYTKKNKTSVSLADEGIYYYGNNTICQAEFYDGRLQVFEKASFYFMDDEFSLQKQINASYIKRNEKSWIAENGSVTDFSKMPPRTKVFKKLTLKLNETPEDFKTMNAIPEELSWSQLYQYTKRLQEKGYTPVSYQVKLYYRAAFPFAPFTLVIWGIVISLYIGIQGSIVKGAGIALIIFSLYHLFLQIGISLAMAGFISPFSGVWTGKIIFTGTGVFLLYRKCNKI